MSITKLFVNVFGEDIFTKPAPESLESSYEENIDCAALRSSRNREFIKTDPNKEQQAQNESALSEQIKEVKRWLNMKLSTIEEEYKYKDTPKEDIIRPKIVAFETQFGGSIRVSSDRLSVLSQSSFSTIKANSCVYGGRWMYEIFLHTKGVMQIGWATNKCQFNENRGVGDSKLSYGFDGSKQQIWHISTKSYGEHWQIGDIIGVTIDIENELIEYYRNGKSLGYAFTKLNRGPGVAFYPAISLGFNQSVMANFGNIPFKYPVEGYNPLQKPPIVKLKQAELLLHYLMKLATVIARFNCCHNKKSEKDKIKFSTKKTVYVIFATIIFDRLMPLLFDSYVINDEFLLAIYNICLLNTIPSLPDSTLDLKEIQEKDDFAYYGEQGTNESVLGAFLSLFYNYLEADEMKYLMKKLVSALLAEYSHTHQGLDYNRQLNIMKIMIGLCRHKQTRKSLLETKLFMKHCLPLFLYVRPPEFQYLQQLLPDSHVWTEAIGGNKSRYLSIIDKINNSTVPLYALHFELLMLLLNNEDGDAHAPSSLKIFLTKLRRYIMDVSLDQRPFHAFLMMQSSILYPIEPQVALSFLCILVDITRTLFLQHFKGQQQTGIDPKHFFDGSLEYQHFDRLGGVLSHLRKIYRSEMVQMLGNAAIERLNEQENAIMRDPDPFMFGSIAVVGHQMGNRTRIINITKKQEPLPNLPPGNVDPTMSLYELLDLEVLYYYGVAHRYVVKIAAARDELAMLSNILNETKFYSQDVERKLKAFELRPAACTEDQNCSTGMKLKGIFSQRERTFTKRSISLARKQIWFRAYALGMKRRLLLIWLLERIVSTLNSAASMGPILSFVPEVYLNIMPLLLDTVMDFSFHDVATQYNITDAECAVRESAKFLSVHSADSRIVLASCKDSVLQSLGTLTCHKSGINALELAPEKSQQLLVRSLLRPYENRAWGQSNWLMLRFWLGYGFAYKDSRQPSVWQGGNEPYSFGICRSRSKTEQQTGLLHNIAPPNPSPKFQQLIGKTLKEDEPFATTFMNSVLSQLNWAFSEFILLLQEIQNASIRQESTVFEPKQMKICAMCFELTVSLMRCLEFVITVAPDVFKDPSRNNSDLLLNRVFQLISQVLSRVTVPPGCFQFVIDMCSTDLNGVGHFPIITAAFGILLALLRSEMEDKQQPVKVTRISRALLTDPSFQFANLEFALGEVRTPIFQQTELPRGNFDPSTRGHIDPLTNETRLPVPTIITKRIRADPPILKFAITDFPTHVTQQEVTDVRNLIEMLRKKQVLLSDIILPSEDSLCPICCAKPIAVKFFPCRHQSCNNCIMQHLMNSKVCFFCKTLIKYIEASDGKVIYTNAEDPMSINSHIFGTV